MRSSRRRAVLAAAALAAAPLCARAEQQQKTRRIGYLSGLPEAHPRARWAREMLRESLQAVGYDERNLAIEWRWGSGDPARLPALAEELVRAGVELIVATSNAEIAAAMRATRTVPIVMLYGIAPVEVGFIDSLARPGGNVTGTAWSSPETFAKTLQILQEAKPSARRIAVLGDPTMPGMARFRAELDRAARSLGLTLERFEATRAEDVPAVLERIAASRPDAFFLAISPALETRLRDIGAFLLETRLVSMAPSNVFALDGNGLLTYSPVPRVLLAQAVGHIDRILRGAKPAEMPVDLPAKYSLVISARTARAIGFTVPSSLLLRADRVID
ncbi:MAG TPA: ABC transporter substrate-binding protein [Burkholderiales bacterium]|nr:ABC transporter substrate-binding protein [Burkholderiales bacterium]